MRTRLKLFVLPLLVAVACGDDEEIPDNPDGGGNPDAGDPNACPSPAAWSAPNFNENAADALALRAQLAALTGVMQDAEAAAAIESSDLTEAYASAGDPSLEAVTTDTYRSIIENAFADFKLLIEDGGHQTNVVDSNGEWTGGPNGTGAVFRFVNPDDSVTVRALNGGGIEPRQVVDKGLFGGGAFYNYALGLTEGTITKATIDALAAAWGTDDALTPEVDDSANYAFAMGFHAETVEALTAAKAYAEDNRCTAELDEAIQRFFSAWEQALLARTVYYAFEAGSALGASPLPSDKELADALHELSEGIGLALGLYGVPDPTSGPMSGSGRMITDAQLEDIMGVDGLGVDLDALNDSTTGEFVTDSDGFEAARTVLEDIVVDVYGVTDITDYQKESNM